MLRAERVRKLDGVCKLCRAEAAPRPPDPPDRPRPGPRSGDDPAPVDPVAALRALRADIACQSQETP